MQKPELEPQVKQVSRRRGMQMKMVVGVASENPDFSLAEKRARGLAGCCLWLWVVGCWARSTLERGVYRLDPDLVCCTDTSSMALGKRGCCSLDSPLLLQMTLPVTRSVSPESVFCLSPASLSNTYQNAPVLPPLTPPSSLRSFL